MISNEKYLLDYWTAVEAQDSVQVVRLPGKTKPDVAANTLVLGSAPLSSFDNLPDAPRFLDIYKQPPSAIIQLGGTALLALVAADISEQDKESGINRQVLVLLSNTSNREVAKLSSGDSRYEITRRRLQQLTNKEHPNISRHHAAIGAFGAAWLLQDTQSLFGTKVAVEQGTVTQPASKLEVGVAVDEPLYIPDEFLCESLVDH